MCIGWILYVQHTSLSCAGSRCAYGECMWQLWCNDSTNEIIDNLLIIILQCRVTVVTPTPCLFSRHLIFVDGISTLILWHVYARPSFNFLHKLGCRSESMDTPSTNLQPHQNSFGELNSVVIHPPGQHKLSPYYQIQYIMTNNNDDM